MLHFKLFKYFCCWNLNEEWMNDSSFKHKLCYGCFTIKNYKNWRKTVKRLTDCNVRRNSRLSWWRVLHFRRPTTPISRPLWNFVDKKQKKCETVISNHFSIQFLFLHVLCYDCKRNKHTGLRCLWTEICSHRCQHLRTHPSNKILLICNPELL